MLVQKVVDFFDKTVTHVISDAEIPPRSDALDNSINKENHCDKPTSKRGITDSIRFLKRYGNTSSELGDMLIL